MDNHPYIRFVDTHTEGIGSHDDSHLVLLPGFLALIFYRWQESCMIEGALDAILVEQGGNLLGTFPASGIDDGRAFCASQDMHHLVDLVAYGAYDICQILALKTHFEHILLLEMQFFLYVVDNVWCSRSGKGKDRGVGFHIPDAGNIQVGRTEIVAPLADTMGFIYSDETHRYMAQFGLENLGGESFG